MNNAFLFNQLCTFKWILADFTLKAECVKDDVFYKYSTVLLHANSDG